MKTTLGLSKTGRGQGGKHYRLAWRLPEVDKQFFDSLAVGEVIEICSGNSDYPNSVKLDLFERADIRADLFNVPVRPLSFDTILFDPPFTIYYDIKLRKKLNRAILYYCRIARKRLVILGNNTRTIPCPKGFAVKLYYRLIGNEPKLCWVYDREVMPLLYSERGLQLYG